MRIKRIDIQNIKSFMHLISVDFAKDMNIIIGPNGAGKSNFMDILCITIRTFFLKTYRLSEPNYGDGKQKTIQHLSQQANLHFIKQLEKYIGNETLDSKVEIELIVVHEDVKNIHLMVANIEEYIRILHEKYHFNTAEQIINNFISIIKKWKKEDLINIKKDSVYKYTITNNIISSVIEPDAKLFLEYLNLYELVSILHKEASLTPVLNTPFMYIGPNRDTSTSSMMTNLSESSQYDDAYNYIMSTSKTNTSVMSIAALYFAEKRRTYETEEKGFLLRWENDHEVRNVIKYLELIGYTWDMDILDKKKNIYSICLYQDKKKISAYQASSGERALLIFLLGIYAFRVTNSTIVIDEPELHLHPRWQKVILSFFKDLTNETGNQIVFSTHASAFIAHDTYKNIIRIYKDQNKTSLCQSFNEETMEGIPLTMIHQIINATNSEQIFFADIVILVEGITDRLIFQKIIKTVQKLYSDRRVIEIVEIKGKTNIGYYRSFLNALKIKNFFIADLDYVNEADKRGDIKAMFKVDVKKIKKDVIDNPKSMDGDSLCKAIESSIDKNDIELIKPVWNYIKSTRRKLKTLTPEQITSRDKFIEEQEKMNTFILSRGAIEAYLPTGFRSKKLENIISLLEEGNFIKWKQQETYQDLKLIVEKILKYTVD